MRKTSLVGSIALICSGSVGYANEISVIDEPVHIVVRSDQHFQLHLHPTTPLPADQFAGSLTGIVGQAVGNHAAMAGASVAASVAVGALVVTALWLAAAPDAFQKYENSVLEAARNTLAADEFEKIIARTLSRRLSEKYDVKVESYLGQARLPEGTARRWLQQKKAKQAVIVTSTVGLTHDFCQLWISLDITTANARSNFSTARPVARHRHEYLTEPLGGGSKEHCLSLLLKDNGAAFSAAIENATESGLRHFAEAASRQVTSPRHIRLLAGRLALKYEGVMQNSDGRRKTIHTRDSRSVSLIPDWATIEAASP